MKKLTKTAILAVSAALVSHAVQAGDWTPDDLYLGFDSATAASDYIVNLGQGSIYANATSVINLSGDVNLSTFNSVFTSGANGVNLGVVGGNFGSDQSLNDLYTTQWRTGGAGIAAAAGSPNLSSNPHSATFLATGAAPISGMSPYLPAGAGSGYVDGNKSFYHNIAPTFTAQSFYGATGINPLGTIDSSGTVYEDLWHATPNSPYTYLGYFTLNLGGSSPSLTFTPKAVPEPTTISFLGGAALLGLLLRRKAKRQNA